MTLAAGTDPLSQGLPVLCVMLLGGFTTNFLWCAFLIRRNGSVGELVGKTGPAVDADGQPPPLLNNYLLAALGGTLWYFQFFFCTMGESQMGRYSFSSWTLHMASIILFSTLWGFALKEWAGSSARTRALVWLGIARWLARPLSSGSAFDGTVGAYVRGIVRISHLRRSNQAPQTARQIGFELSVPRLKDVAIHSTFAKLAIKRR